MFSLLCFSSVTVALRIKFTPTYPESSPEINIDIIKGELSDVEQEEFLNGLLKVVSENWKL